MYLAITAVEALPDFQLLLRFENGERRVFDMKPLLSTGLFSQLKDEALFRSVSVQFDTIEWCNGVDLDPEMLYHQSRVQAERDSHASGRKRSAAASVRETRRRNRYGNAGKTNARPTTRKKH